RRYRDAPLFEAARISRPVTDDVDDSARLLHDEAERHVRDAPRKLAGILQDSSVRAAAPDARLPDSVQAARRMARGNHRLCRYFAAAERRFARRIRRPPLD